MSYLLAISLAVMGGCLLGSFATHVWYYYTGGDEDYWNDDEDLWK